MDKLQDYISVLSEREKIVIESLLSGDKIVDIARKFNVNRDFITRIRDKAVKKLRNRIKLTEFLKTSE